jgi:hypothetical protein
MRESLSPPSQPSPAGAAARLSASPAKRVMTIAVMMGGGRRAAAKKILGELILNFGSGRVKKKGVGLERNLLQRQETLRPFNRGIKEI